MIPRIRGRPDKTVEDPGVYILEDNKGKCSTAVAGPFLTAKAAYAVIPLLEHRHPESGPFVAYRVFEDEL